MHRYLIVPLIALMATPATGQYTRRHPQPLFPAARVVYAIERPAEKETTLSITGELTIRPYKFARLKAAGELSGKTLLWDIVPEEKIDAEEHDGQIWFIGPPGTYRVKLRAISDGKIEVTRTTVTIEGPPQAVAAPLPSQPPLPDATAPLAGKLWVVVIEPPNELVPIILDAELWQQVEAMGHRWRVYERNDPTVAQNHYLDVLKDSTGKPIPLPAVLLIDEHGRHAALKVPDESGGCTRALAICEVVRGLHV